MAAALPRAAFERAAPDQFETMPMTGQVGGSCDIAVIRDRAGFESLAAEWKELFERAGRPGALVPDFRMARLLGGSSLRRSRPAAHSDWQARRPSCDGLAADHHDKFFWSGAAGMDGRASRPIWRRAC